MIMNIYPYFFFFLRNKHTYRGEGKLAKSYDFHAENE